ncbi:protein argonaute 4B [Panicum miliaceum]|uniref:Protein argonaute 4B n=1 Tax=Panicum miliaceum TaxID=4540 RepID=A0A3L6QWH4_PANMI|nr:protein argonaute 4B [Panicum miliaceum]
MAQKEVQYSFVQTTSKSQLTAEILPSTTMYNPIAILSCELFGPEISSNNLQQTVTICHTQVNLKYEDDQPVAQKGVGRKVIDKLQETYASDLENLNFFAYDGEKSLFTIGALQNVKDVFTVVVEDASSAKTPGGDGSPEGSDMKRMKRLMGCLLVRQSFFHSPSKIINLGGGVVPCPGYHSSFRLTQSGLSLNMDVSTTMILEPGPVINFILSSQYINNKDTRRIDWGKLCDLMSLQRYTKALTVPQRSSLVQNSRRNPSERKSDLSAALKLSKYNSDSILKKCGISIAPEFIQVNGRVLHAPKLKAGNGRDIFVRDWKWNFNNNRLIRATRVNRWVVVDFSSHCNIPDLVRRLIQCGKAKGMQMDREDAVIEENPGMRLEPAPNRVKGMFVQIERRFPDKPPAFLLCVLPERKNCDIYALEMEEKCAIPLVSQVETMILGMDVSHGSPGRDLPSVAAEANRRLSQQLRKISQQIIIFRDGVSVGQFTQVLSIELPQIIEACKFLQDNWSPKFMVIVAQKNHHTRFFRDDKDGSNVPAGTVVDEGICHHRDYDFYMCAHAGRIGTTRPTHYHVLYQRSTSAISVVAPLYYAHLAAAQVRQFVRFDDSSETGSSASGGPAPVPELPRLN